MLQPTVRSVRSAIGHLANLSEVNLGIWVRDQLLAERERWILWLPVLFGFGIGFYFLWPHEPRRASIIIVCAITFGALLVTWRRDSWRLIVLACLLPILGFSLSSLRTYWVAAPALTERLGPTQISGRIIAVDSTANGVRATLDHLQISRLPSERTPASIRVTLRQTDQAKPGDWIAVTAILLPPTPPQEPGAYDFTRAAYFQRLGAVGFAVQPAREIAAPESAEKEGWNLNLNLATARHELAARFERYIEGQAGPIAAALITGERGNISDETNRIMNDSGLAHLLSISGIHLAFVAGLIFFLTRILLALIPSVTLHWPIKKISAMAALLATFFYMLLSGSAVPTQRSFLTTAIVLLAIMVDRSAISLRLVALAALVILATQPESLLNISFQMSFAAVIALIAAYEAGRNRYMALRANSGLFQRAMLHIGGVAATTLLAGFATAPLVAYHFNRFVDYGLVANLIAVPLTGFVIMPLGLLGLVLMPFDLEQIALLPMGMAIDAMIWVAQTVANWPGAVLNVSAVSDETILLVILGGLWLCLWKQRWRYLGLVPMLFAGVLHLSASRPDILIEPEGRLFAVRGGDGRLLISDAKINRLARETWVRRDGGSSLEPFPKMGASKDGRLRCDPAGCLYRHEGVVVALPRRSQALDEDCRSADLIVAPFRVTGRCASARMVIDADDIHRDGAIAIRIGGQGQISMETVRERRGKRPWALGQGSSALEN